MRNPSHWEISRRKARREAAIGYALAILGIVALVATIGFVFYAIQNGA